jgi:hypothetical protein
MSDSKSYIKQDAQFNMAFGWLAATATIIAGWAGLA